MSQAAAGKADYRVQISINNVTNSSANHEDGQELQGDPAADISQLLQVPLNEVDLCESGRVRKYSEIMITDDDVRGPQYHPASHLQKASHAASVCLPPYTMGDNTAGDEPLKANLSRGVHRPHQSILEADQTHEKKQQYASQQ